MKKLLVLFLIFLCGCQFGGYEIIVRKASDGALIKAINDNPEKYEGMEVEIRGIIDGTAKREWAKVSGGPYLYVKKAVAQQTFEYEVDYVVRGTIRYGEIPFAGTKPYIEADELITKD
ncbi:hypothetical protein KY360_02700 [Candidatus Woesearchaeota archaeon]|nr:hypothetical protein [Candidatus Woesearchaeota archaeon]